jgi:hypothetical protein
MDLELNVDDIYDDIKKSMKLIIQQTNDILKDSQNAFKKVKEKMVDLERIELTPSDNIKEWFLEKNHTKFTIPDLFELLFSSSSNKLEFNTKTIILCEKDAIVFGFTPNTPISIYEIFERLTTYFQ